ncbi:MAG: hypothetical protein IT513_13365 [Burkholderiales bacterium]|nr:hypothetical protein [Burkholderiales bacterium]
MVAEDRVASLGYRIVAARGASERIELHVLARAYRECWLALHAEAPSGRHWFDHLGIAIDFGAPRTAN